MLRVRRDLGAKLLHYPSQIDTRRLYRTVISQISDVEPSILTA